MPTEDPNVTMDKPYAPRQAEEEEEKAESDNTRDARRQESAGSTGDDKRTLLKVGPDEDGME